MSGANLASPISLRTDVSVPLDVKAGRKFRSIGPIGAKISLPLGTSGAAVTTALTAVADQLELGRVREEPLLGISSEDPTNDVILVASPSKPTIEPNEVYREIFLVSAEWRGEKFAISVGDDSKRAAVRAVSEALLRELKKL